MLYLQRQKHSCFFSISLTTFSSHMCMMQQNTEKKRDTYNPDMWFEDFGYLLSYFIIVLLLFLSEWWFLIYTTASHRIALPSCFVTRNISMWKIVASLLFVLFVLRVHTTLQNFWRLFSFILCIFCHGKANERKKWVYSCDMCGGVEVSFKRRILAETIIFLLFTGLIKWEKLDYVTALFRILYKGVSRIFVILSWLRLFHQYIISFSCWKFDWFMKRYFKE